MQYCISGFLGMAACSLLLSALYLNIPDLQEHQMFKYLKLCPLQSLERLLLVAGKMILINQDHLT